MHPRRSRSGKMNIFGLILFLGLVAGLVLAYVFVPPWLVYVKMQEITESVVLDWEGLNEGKARRRLPEELRRQEVPEYITPEMCEFKQDGKNKEVSCYWEIDVYYPYTDYFKTLSFETWAMHDGVGLVDN